MIRFCSINGLASATWHGQTALSLSSQSNQRKAGMKWGCGHRHFIGVTVMSAQGLSVDKGQ